MSTALSSKNEFKLTDDDFNFIVKMIYDHAGIVLSDRKRDLVHSRLGRRLRELGLSCFKEYCQYVKSADGADEVTLMTNALTTNLTSFYRESHHFDHLKNVVIPGMKDLASQNARRLRIWSSACSTGEEPYSIAMTLLDSGIDRRNWDARILATDLNTDVLAAADAGLYSADVCEKLPGALRRFIDPQTENGKFRVKTDVRNLITFKQLNLLGTWPMRHPFDVIFCRNVLIYFDNETKIELINRFVSLLRPGGWLYLGHSETLNGNHQGLALTGRTIYRRGM